MQVEPREEKVNEIGQEITEEKEKIGKTKLSQEERGEEEETKEEVTRPGRGGENTGKTEIEEVTNKTGVDAGEEEEEGGDLP